jgi:hypothetical protein
MLDPGDAERLNGLVADLREHLALMGSATSLLDTMAQFAIRLYPKSVPTFNTPEGKAPNTPFRFAYSLLDPTGGGLPNYRPPLDALLVELLVAGDDLQVEEGEHMLPSLAGLSYSTALRSVAAAAIAKKMIHGSEEVRQEVYRRLRLEEG